MTRTKPVATEAVLQVQFPLCHVETSIESLSQDFEIPLVGWYEPGLGPAAGFACQLASGRVLFIRQLEWARESMNAGPEIHVEAAQLAEQGVDAQLDEVLPALGISGNAVQWRQTADGVAAAAGLAVLQRRR